MRVQAGAPSPLGATWIGCGTNFALFSAHAERVTLVYRIRIDVGNPAHELVPGMPADARIDWQEPGP